MKTKGAAEAKAVLKEACYRCHGENGTIEGGFSFVLDRAQLVARKLVVPGASAKSKLIRRIQNNEMPPEGETPLTKEQTETLTNWIDIGAPDFNPPKGARSFVSTNDLVGAMRADQKQSDSADRKFIRYLTLTHLYNAGRSDEELQSYRHGITKLVNSLSWGRKIVVPVAVGPQKTILRIDIRDYKWSSTVWDKLAAADPFGMSYATNDARDLVSDAGCALPFVRGDWFVASASRPPLYHEILQLPRTDKELETLLHVDVDENIRTGQAVRAGFNGSAVSRNNRMIERHESSYGYYWKSYDFAKNIERQNLFAHPLGPGKTDSMFKHDGGEIIFSLPNGLQAYLLVNSSGQRIDKGPTEIVSDPKQPDRAVENGLSCMSCHVRGILPKDDQIRAHVENNPGAFPKKELDSVLALYAPQERFQSLVKEDSEKFRKSYEQSGLPTSISEPIKALAALYESELDLALAAAEANLKVSEFQELLKSTPNLARVLGSLQTTGGTVQRETFSNTFVTLARAAKIGNPLWKAATGATTIPDTAAKTAGPKKKLVAKLGEAAKPHWLLKPVIRNAPIYSDRGYKFVTIPKEIQGSQYLMRDSGDGNSWFPDESVNITGNGVVYAFVRWKALGKVEVDEAAFAQLERDGWTILKDEAAISFPPGEDWRWKALKKDLSDEGGVVLPLSTLNWGKRVVVFAFK